LSTSSLLGSHTKAVHKQFDSRKTKNDVLTGRSHVLSTLKMGDMSIYDSRVLHCGTANRSDRQRILLYATFKNPSGPSDDDDFWNVASIRPEYVGKFYLNDFMDG
jgi:ectoine hydroxylase-related dioxygenase (phytanoyl-CoA dioxygenase family)